MIINESMKNVGEREWELENRLKRTKEYVYLGINPSEDGCD